MDNNIPSRGDCHPQYHFPSPPAAPRVPSPAPPPAAPLLPDLRGERRFVSRVGLAYFVLFAVSTAVQLIVTFVVELLAPGVAYQSWYLYALSALSLYLCGAPLVPLLLRPLPRYTPAPQKLGAGRFWLCFLMALGLMFVGNILGQLSNAGLSALFRHSSANPVEALVGGSSLLYNFLFAVLLAPVMEELLFRKLLADRLLRYGQGTAVLCSGLFFGLFHGNLYQFFYAFLLGLLLAYIYVHTGRLRYTIALHMLINLIGAFTSPLLNWLMELGGISGSDLSGLMDHLGSAMLSVAAVLLYSLAYLGCCIAGVVLLFVRRKRLSLLPGPCALPRGRRFTTLFLNPGVLLFLLFSLAMFAVNFILV